MSDLSVTVESSKGVNEVAEPKKNPTDKPIWVSPKLEDVSEQVMAQPYIRFT